jgi:hypothetical protein
MTPATQASRLPPAWRTALATAAGYGALLLATFVVLFVVPTAVVALLP